MSHRNTQCVNGTIYVYAFSFLYLKIENAQYVYWPFLWVPQQKTGRNAYSGVAWAYPITILCLVQLQLILSILSTFTLILLFQVAWILIWTKNLHTHLTFSPLFHYPSLTTSLLLPLYLFLSLNLICFYKFSNLSIYLYSICTHTHIYLYI